MKKKLLTIALVAGMVLSLTACGSKGDDAADSAAESSVSEEAAAEEEVSAPEEPAAEEEAAAPEEEAGMTLDEWVQSDEARQAEDLTNASLAGDGMTMKLKADGDILVYEYTMPDNDGYSDLSEEDLEAAFGPVIEQNESSITDVYDSFDSEYGIKLAGVRFTFILADGTELYSGEIANE